MAKQQVARCRSAACCFHLNKLPVLRNHFTHGGHLLITVRRARRKRAFHHIVWRDAFIRLRRYVVGGQKRNIDCHTRIGQSHPGELSAESIAPYALFAPAGTPAEIIAFLNRDVNVVLRQADVRDKLAEQGIEVSGSTPDALAVTVNSEIAKWAKVIKDGNIKPE